MWLCLVPSLAPTLRHPPPLARSRWHTGEQTSGAKQIDENCTNKINKNQAAVAPLWLSPVERELCSLPDDATINEIPVIDCFKLLWRLETGRVGKIAGEREKFSSLLLWKQEQFMRLMFAGCPGTAIAQNLLDSICCFCYSIQINMPCFEPNSIVPHPQLTLPGK